MSSTSLTETLFAFWRRLAPLPGGTWIFSRILGRLAPYTGSMGAHVTLLEPGHAVVQLSDRRRVRNHLNSVHAVALINLGEVATGLAVISQLPPGTRGIVTSLGAEYHKKARGLLVADCRTGPFPATADPVDRDVSAEIVDQAGDVVAVISARWRISS